MPQLLVDPAFGPIVGSIVQALLGLSAVTGGLALLRGYPRALCLVVAALLFLSMPVLHGTGAGSALAPALTAALMVVLVALAVGLGLLSLREARRAERTWSEEGAHKSLEAQGSRTRRESLNQRLQRLLQREHEKLETVNQMHRYFELATRNSQITMFYQDADLVYRWIVNPRVMLTPDDVVGRSDDDYLPTSVRSLVVGHKRRALATNTTQTFEVELPARDERAWFRVDVVPISEGRAEPSGIVCTAIDITRSKRLDMMRTDLSRRLAETLQRFNLALRSERIMVFSQDLDLRYTWANSDETPIGSIIGRTDEEVIPEPDRDAIVSLKREAIASKRACAAEVGVGSGPERRWYDLNVEPNLRPDGSVSGITCASIDITHRKRNEEQMRLVLRELTHRTKNLLAVVIAIARQTSTQSSSVETFVPALIGRLRALAAAQDLIVADDWAGVYISDLLRVLIGQYVPPQSARVSVSGPPVMLSPEASQNLGLAIHELASNAMQYGAFSNDSGTLKVEWDRIESAHGEQLDFRWTEEGGPNVSEPTRSGFGMMVIERNLSRALGAEVTMRFDRTGLQAHIVLPLEGVMPAPSPDRVELKKVG